MTERERERRIERCICQNVYIVNIAVGGDFGNCMHTCMGYHSGWGRQPTTTSVFHFDQRFNPFEHTVALFKVRMLFARTRREKNRSQACMHACMLCPFEMYCSSALELFTITVSRYALLSARGRYRKILRQRKLRKCSL